MTETPNPYIVDTATMTGEMRPIRQAVVSLGSNLGERIATLQGALSAIADTPDVTVVAVSSVYETDPVDSPDWAGQFLNAVVLLDTTLHAHTLLERCLAVEDAFGRTRGDEHNAPRTLDVDLLVVGEREASDDHLTLPHPRAHERAFVLTPWLEIDAEAYIPGKGMVADLLEDLDRGGVHKLDDAELML